MPEAVGSKGDDVIVSNTREMEKQRRKLDKEIKQRQKDAERKKLKDEKKRQKEAEKQEAKERKKEKKVNASSTLYFSSTIINKHCNHVIMAFVWSCRKTATL